METDLTPETIKLIRKIVREEFRRVLNESDDWISTEEAARILGITPRYLRRIKDRYPWKQEVDKGKILFKRSALLL